MEDPAKKRAHSLPSNYITLQQLQERRLREQQQREEEERQRQLPKQRREEEKQREEEEKQRQLQKQREEEEKNRNRQHGESVQSQRIKAAGRAEKKISGGGVETLATEGEIKGQEGGVNSNKGKKKIQKPRGKRSSCVGKAKQEGGSAGSDHGEMDGVDGSSEKSTEGKRQVHWRATTLRRETAVTGEKMTKMNGSERNLRNGKELHYRRMKGAGRPAGFDGPDGSDDRSEKKPLRQIVKANREDEADGENEGTGIVKVLPTVVLDDSDEADERSTAENQGASPTKKPVVVAAEMGRKPYGSNPVSAGSMAETRSNCPRSGGRYRGGRGSGFREKYSHREPAAKGVWVPKEEIPDARPSATAGARGEVNTPKPPVYRRNRGYFKAQAGNWIDYTSV